MEDVLGVAVFLRTPLEGVRVGGTILRGTTTLGRALDVPPMPPPPPGTPPLPLPQPGAPVFDGSGSRTMRSASVDGKFSRFAVRAEYFRDELPGIEYSAYYGLASVKPIDKVTLNFQYSLAKSKLLLPGLPLLVLPYLRDLAASVNYSPFSQVVLKLEGHEGEGAGFFAPPPVNRYFIVSLAVSF